MPQILIIEPTIVNYGDDRGGVHADVAEIATVSKSDARALVTARRALYANRKDDPSRNGSDTASERMLEGAAAMRAARDHAVDVSDADQGAPVTAAE